MASRAEIPLVYRALFLYFEPLAAFGGAIQSHFLPLEFLSTFLVAPPSAVSADYQIIFDQLAATYLLFAWNEAVVLRLTADLKIWKAIIFGILMCDLVHLYGSLGALGPEIFWNPALWRWQEWLNFSMLYVPGALRLSFLFGIGLGGRSTGSRKSKGKKR